MIRRWLAERVTVYRPGRDRIWLAVGRFRIGGVENTQTGKLTGFGVGVTGWRSVAVHRRPGR